MSISNISRRELISKAALLAVGLSAFSLSLGSSLAVAEGSFPENDNLTPEEIEDRFSIISNSYAVGEEFSASDANFVMRYANTSQASTRASDSFSVVDTYYGQTYGLNGTGWNNGQGAFSYTIGGEGFGYCEGTTPRSMTLCIRLEAYGLIGSDGVGKIFEDTSSNTSYSSTRVQHSVERPYGGYFVGWRVSSWIDVVDYAGNTFTACAGNT